MASPNPLDRTQQLEFSNGQQPSGNTMGSGNEDHMPMQGAHGTESQSGEMAAARRSDAEDGSVARASPEGSNDQPQPLHQKLWRLIKDTFSGGREHPKPTDNPPDWFAHIKDLLDHNNHKPLHHKGWNVSKDILTVILIPLGVILLTRWLDYQTEKRQEISSQEQTHQAIFDRYMNNLKEIRLSSDYQERNKNERDSFIKQMTLPTLRELTVEDGDRNRDRKAQLVLLLYEMDLVKFPEDSQQVGPLIPNETWARNIANLNTADLKFADFQGYRLEYINFHGADLRGADLSSARLQRAALTHSDISCFSVKEETLFTWLLPVPSGSEKMKENQLNPEEVRKDEWLTWPSFQNSGLKREKSVPICADLSNANLNEANLTGADLRGADLRGADFTNAILTNAILTEADFTGADLRGATYTAGQFTAEQLNSAIR